ncbi:hypothetical protein KM043_018757 [Ampulex compressa]|nr:hypothetical protein KM043_018757 [Ampulex compressa]
MERDNNGDERKTGTQSREPEEPGSSGTSSASEGRHAEETSGGSVLNMGSTDSAGSAHGGDASCGLVSSLFPSSCRGRAEAFARRLHRRLTSLGNEDGSTPLDGDPSKPRETSWLHAPTSTARTVHGTTSNHVLQRQPRHSPESDLYYDFDLEDDEDDPGSPAEEATAAELADLLVNPRILKANHHDACHCSTNGSRQILPDPESGCVFASPITGTSPESDTSDMYFDPESTDAEKPRGEVFFDPVATSDSEVASSLSNGRASLACRRRLEKNLEDTSESSCSSRRENSCEKRRQEELTCSSEDSLNGRSSLETTSPSHESLWSTFDESTVSLQEEVPSIVDHADVLPQIRLPKSHSDSEIPVNGSGEECGSGSGGEDVVDFVNGLAEGVRSEEDSRKGAKEESLDRLENNLEDESSLEEEEEEEEVETPRGAMDTIKDSFCLKAEDSSISDTDTDHSTYSSTINIPGALTLECPTGIRITEEIMKNEVQLQIENGTVLSGNEEDKMCVLLKKLATSPSIKDDGSPEEEVQEDSIEEEEEEEEEAERPQRIRRCSSLKTGKTPPGTPGRKKIVRFADVLGLDLADVRTFLDEIPKVPNSAYSDLIYDDIFQKDTSPVNTTSNCWGTRYLETRRSSGATIVPRKLDRTLVPLFQQPGGLPTFLDLVRERRVCLENVLVEDPVSLCIRGTVRVINLDFHKSVHIRYTLNSWRNFSDLQATYVNNSCDGFSDKFSFVLYCHTLPVGQRLEFAVRFHCKGTQYWDNNNGANYCFQCLPVTSTVGYIPITTSESGQHRHEWSPVFY